MNALRRCALALSLLLAASAPASAVERIIQFISDVTVQRDGDLIVIETIQVEAEGNAIRRGIFRDFPTIYTRPDGTRVEVGFHLESVTRNGAAENSAIERLPNGVRVRIGSADRTISRGQHTYVIRYRTTRQVGFFNDYDELYWNVTGTGWIFRIDSAEARITLPEKVPFRQTAVYTGPQGANGRDATVVEQRPGTIVFRTTRVLPPHNGLTVAAAWQKGVVEPPGAARIAQFWFEDNRALVAAALGLLLILAYYAYAWLRVGRDPPVGTIIPLFGPPGDMSPAATRYVDRMAFDNGCFTAAIISLGVKGHLQIVEQDGKSTLKKRGGGAKPMTPEESALMVKLFSKQSNLLLDQKNHEPIGKAKTALGEALTKRYLGTLFKNNFGWSIAGLLLLVVLVLVVLLAAATGHQYNIVPYVVATSVFGLPFVMGGAAMIFNAWQHIHVKKGLLIWGLIMLGLAVAIGMFVMWYNAPGAANLCLLGSLFGSGAIVGAGFLLLKAASQEGRKTMDQIEGFREYLGVAEEDRLNALNPPEKTPELFERFLPYAIALDCQNAWAAKFAGVLAAAGAAAAATSWYVGSRDWSNDPVSFADHLGSDLSQTIASSSTPPGSSDSGGGGGGSSGGGSSGGGGGGGGGGGW